MQPTRTMTTLLSCGAYPEIACVAQGGGSYHIMIACDADVSHAGNGVQQTVEQRHREHQSQRSSIYVHVSPVYDLHCLFFESSQALCPCPSVTAPTDQASPQRRPPPPPFTDIARSSRPKPNFLSLRTPLLPPTMPAARDSKRDVLCSAQPSHGCARSALRPAELPRLRLLEMTGWDPALIVRVRTRRDRRTVCANDGNLVGRVDGLAAAR